MQTTLRAAGWRGTERQRCSGSYVT